MCNYVVGTITNITWFYIQYLSKQFNHFYRRRLISFVLNLLIPLIITKFLLKHNVRTTKTQIILRLLNILNMFIVHITLDLKNTLLIESVRINLFYRSLMILFLTTPYYFFKFVKFKPNLENHRKLRLGAVCIIRK